MDVKGSKVIAVAGIALTVIGAAIFFNPFPIQVSPDVVMIPFPDFRGLPFIVVGLALILLSRRWKQSQADT